VLTEGAVDITPAPRHFDLPFVDRPALAQAAPLRLGGVLRERSKLLPPIEEGRSIHLDRALGQPLDHLGVTEPVAKRPTHGSPDDGGREGVTGERSAGQNGKVVMAVRTIIDLLEHLHVAQPA
jgi:hypothetical protein